MDYCDNGIWTSSNQQREMKKNLYNWHPLRDVKPKVTIPELTRPSSELTLTKYRSR